VNIILKRRYKNKWRLLANSAIYWRILLLAYTGNYVRMAEGVMSLSILAGP
jgi:hypothetical protein